MENWVHNLLSPANAKPAIAITVWYFFNISTLILNKYLYQVMQFTYPVTLTVIHMLTCAIGAFLVLRIFISATPFTFKNLSDETYKKKIIPIALIFCINIVLGNLSLRYIPVSFMQTIKSSVPGFNVLIQVMLGAKFSKNTYMSLVLVVGGVALASVTETNFNMLGFLYAMASSVTTSLQAIISSKLLTSKEEKLDSMNLVYYMSPLSFLFLFPVGYLQGEYSALYREWPYFGELSGTVMLLISGLIAFGLNISTFFVISSTSALTATVAGNFKVILSIFFSVMVFKNKITFINGVGCALAVIGVWWYNMIRLEENNRGEAQKQQVKTNAEQPIVTIRN